MPDEQERSLRVIVAELRDTFIAAGIDPADSDAREMLGGELRWLRDLKTRREARQKWSSTVVTTILVALFTTAMTAIGPIILRVILTMAAK